MLKLISRICFVYPLNTPQAEKQPELESVIMLTSGTAATLFILIVKIDQMDVEEDYDKLRLPV